MYLEEHTKNEREMNMVSGTNVWENMVLELEKVLEIEKVRVYGNYSCSATVHLSHQDIQTPCTSKGWGFDSYLLVV